MIPLLEKPYLVVGTGQLRLSTPDLGRYLGQGCRPGQVPQEHSGASQYLSSVLGYSLLSVTASNTETGLNVLLVSEVATIMGTCPSSTLNQLIHKLHVPNRPAQQRPASGTSGKQRVAGLNIIGSPC